MFHVRVCAAQDILVTTCSIYCPTPSMASMVVNHFKMRKDIQVITGCIEGRNRPWTCCALPSEEHYDCEAMQCICATHFDCNKTLVLHQLPTVIKHNACLCCLQSYHTGGMGCSNGVVGINMIHDLLQVRGCLQVCAQVKA
jgi:hypothetical protein